MVDRHKLTVFYLKSFDMDSVQVGKAPKICRSKKYEEPTPLNVLKRDEKW